MRDILYTCSTAESREALVSRLTRDVDMAWSLAPRETPRRLYLVHRGEIIGWLAVVEVCDADDDDPLVLRSRQSGEMEARTGRHLITKGPIRLLKVPVVWMGFRGFRYCYGDDFA